MKLKNKLIIKKINMRLKFKMKILIVIIKSINKEKRIILVMIFLKK